MPTTKIRIGAAAEVARLLGVSTARVHALVAKPEEDFPEPIATLSVGKIWMTEDVEAWMRRTGRAK